LITSLITPVLFSSRDQTGNSEIFWQTLKKMKSFLGSSIIGLIYAAENQAYLKQDTQRDKEETWEQVFF